MGSTPLARKPPIANQAYFDKRGLFWTFHISLENLGLPKNCGIRKNTCGNYFKSFSLAPDFHFLRRRGKTALTEPFQFEDRAGEQDSGRVR